MDKLIVVDTDAGVDDAWAILMLLAAAKENGNIKIAGITCSHGNTTVNHTYNNVLRTLEASGRLDVSWSSGIRFRTRNDELLKEHGSVPPRQVFHNNSSCQSV